MYNYKYIYYNMIIIILCYMIYFKCSFSIILNLFYDNVHALYCFHEIINFSISLNIQSSVFKDSYLKYKF